MLMAYETAILSRAETFANVFVLNLLLLSCPQSLIQMKIMFLFVFSITNFFFLVAVCCFWVVAQYKSDILLYSSSKLNSPYPFRSH